jgi:hypothetical protein
MTVTDVRSSEKQKSKRRPMAKGARSRNKGARQIEKRAGKVSTEA